MAKQPHGVRPRRRDIVTGLAALPLCVAAPALSTPATQTVVDQTGRTVNIPTQPQRVVSMADVVFTAPLYELGVPIIASARSLGEIHAFEALFGLTASEAGIADIGQSTAYDIERIAALEPDLIVADVSFSNTDGLSLIAPLYTTDYFFGQQSNLGLPQQTAKAFGVEERYLDLMAAYRARISSLRDLLGSDRRKLTWFAAMVSTGDFLVGRSGGAFAAVASDLGLVLPNWVEGIVAPDAFFPLSLEQLPLVDADLVMLMPPYFQKDQSPSSVKNAMTALMPNWERFVPAAQKDTIVYVSGETSIVPAFAAAHLVLDIIEAQWSQMRKATK